MRKSHGNSKYSASSKKREKQKKSQKQNPKQSGQKSQKKGKKKTKGPPRAKSKKGQRPHPQQKHTKGKKPKSNNLTPSPSQPETPTDHVLEEVKTSSDHESQAPLIHNNPVEQEQPHQPEAIDNPDTTEPVHLSNDNDVPFEENEEKVPSYEDDIEDEFPHEGSDAPSDNEPSATAPSDEEGPLMPNFMRELHPFALQTPYKAVYGVKPNKCQKTIDQLWHPKQQCNVSFDNLKTLLTRFKVTIKEKNSGSTHKNLLGPRQEKIPGGIFISKQYGKHYVRHLQSLVWYVGGRPSEK